MLDIKSIQPRINELAIKYDLSLIVLFGSQATGNTHSKSDIDIAILGGESTDKFKVTEDFCDIFKRDDIEVVNLANASPTLMYCVVRDGVSWYEKNEGDFLGWKFHAIRIWMETAWLRKLRDKKAIEQVKAWA